MTTTDPPDDDARFRETTRRFLVLELVTEVRDDGVYVRLGPIQRSFRRLPAARIREATPTSYSATDYGGWHWGVRRTPGGNAVYRLRGGRGVEVVLDDGTTWFVGSRRPEELAAAIERVSDPGG